MPARARAKLSAASSSRPAACWSSPRTLAGAGAGDRSTSAASVATASSRRPCAAARAGASDLGAGQSGRRRAGPFVRGRGPGQVARGQELVADQRGDGGAVLGGAGGLLGLEHGQAGALQVAVELSEVGQAGEGGAAGAAGQQLGQVVLGLVVAAELDAGVDEDGQRVGVVGHLLVGGAAVLEGTGEVVEGQGERALGHGRRRVAGGQRAGPVERVPGEVVEGRVAGDDGLSQVAAGQLLPGGQVLRVGGRAPLELGDGARRGSPDDPADVVPIGANRRFGRHG